MSRTNRFVRKNESDKSVRAEMSAKRNRKRSSKRSDRHQTKVQLRGVAS